MRARTKRLQAVAAIVMHGQWDRSSFPMKQSRSAENRASGPDRTVNNLKECSFKNFACPRATGAHRHWHVQAARVPVRNKRRCITDMRAHLTANTLDGYDTGTSSFDCFLRRFSGGLWISNETVVETFKLVGTGPTGSAAACAVAAVPGPAGSNSAMSE